MKNKINNTYVIIEWLNHIHDKFPYLHIIYLYSAWDMSHYIHMHPINEYFEGEFGKLAFQFENDFSKKFPDELVCFVSMDSFDETEKDDVLLEFKPKFDFDTYKILTKTMEIFGKIILNSFIKFDIETFNYENNKNTSLSIFHSKNESIPDEEFIAA